MQAELAEACEEYGLESKGKKDTLVKNLIRHFESESQEDEIAPGEVVTHNQSAAVMTKPKMSISPMSHPISLGVDDLKDRIEALDETISVRTNELEGLRSADKYVLAYIPHCMAACASVSVSFVRRANYLHCSVSLLLDSRADCVQHQVCPPELHCSSGLLPR
jgi:hypothetical protein